ncbi:ATP-binding protein [Methanococcoides alaskense]|uniref:Magnesium chelatase subunit I n=1 Tax=Methanococcoides alaskense TaxID=325778 RepID=A0AA90TY80_9EURY|nr:AAA family ATPase [Methanococcoides alaskense]MDA0524999.1 AAA family ATPase [Methanococcoides alaskense]MDR6222086.1 magnesium chelatase subunit I [Methanococcoides alaskense]
MSFTNIAGTIREVPKPVEKKRTTFDEIQKTATKTKRVMYPISGIVGQEMMLRALILNAINPSIGGVLVRGQKGTAKSTAVRGLAEILPEIEVISGCKYNCDPMDTDTFCWECVDKQRKGQIKVEKVPMKVVDLPVGATEDRVVGSLDIEKAVKEGTQAFEPGILANANRNILYVDEINLLDDFVVDALLDAAAMNVNTVEREGISVSHPANFIIVGSMNPEEGELRPQLLDRIALQVEVEGIIDIEQRVEIIERRNHFNDDPQGFRRDFESEQDKLRAKILKAKQAIGRISATRDNLRTIAKICVAFNVDGHRADIMIERTARTNAAYEGRERITNEDIIEAAEMVLPHRMRKKPFEEEEFSAEQLRAVVNGTV